MKNIIKFLKIPIRWLRSLPDIYRVVKQALQSNKNVIRLNLGVGPYPIDKNTLKIMNSYGKEWIYIDKYIKQPGTLNYDVSHLPYLNSSVDTIIASHILEHIPFPQVPMVLKHWYKLMKKKGEIYLNVPDLEWMCQRFVDLTKANRQKSNKFKKNFFNKSCDYDDNKHSFLSALYGSHQHEGEVHHSGFTKESIEELMQSIGFDHLEIASLVENHDVGCLIVKAVKS